VIDTDIVIAHPYKHHALHLAAGCVRSQRRTVIAIPFFMKGMGAIVGMLPGRSGQKAKGYAHKGLNNNGVLSPLGWQAKYLLLQHLGKTQEVASMYDRWVARQIENGYLRGRVFVTLQDYMPLSSVAALRAGMALWSDQILNQSDEAMERIRHHYRSLGIQPPYTHDERSNASLVAHASYITAPSEYCLGGVARYLTPKCRHAVIPYGVDLSQFGATKDSSTAKKIRIVSTSNSVRKGGHLLIESLARIGKELSALAHAAFGRVEVEVTVVGDLEPVLAAVLAARNLGPIRFKSGSMPHARVPGILAKANLFILPSLSEGMPVAILEAMASRLPTIISPYCGISQAAEGETGIRVDDSVQSVGDGLLAAFRDVALWSAWGTTAHSVARRLTWDSYELRIADFATAL
jgi:glycosyltransferase involved in cell wall biosynthesis